MGAYGGRVEIMDPFCRSARCSKPARSRQSAGHGRRHRHVTVCSATIPPTQAGSDLAHLAAGLMARGISRRRAAHRGPRRQHAHAVFQSRAGGELANLGQRSDTERYARYFWAMIERGIYLPCSQFEALFVSAAHTPADIDITLAAAREAIAEG